MSVPGFKGESSLYQSGVSYYSSPEGTGTSGPGVLSCLSWNWRKRSFVKITERTYEKRAHALHGR